MNITKRIECFIINGAIPIRHKLNDNPLKYGGILENGMLEGDKVT